MSTPRPHPEQPQTAEDISIFQRMGRMTTATLAATVAIGLALVGVIASQGFSAGLSTSTLGSGQILNLNVGPTGAVGDDGVTDGAPVASTTAADGSDADGTTTLASLPPASASGSGPVGPVVLPDDAGSPGASGGTAPGAGQVADSGPSPEAPGPSGPDDSQGGPGTDEPVPPTEPPAEEPTPTEPTTPVDDGEGEDPGSTPVDNGGGGDGPSVPVDPSVPAEDGEDSGEAGPPGPPAEAPVPESVPGPPAGVPGPPADAGPPVTTPGNGKAKGHDK